MTDVEEILGSPDMGTIVSCPVCRESYNITDRTPVNIPCGHTVCSVCLPGLVGLRLPQFMVCPVCRKNHSPPRGRDLLDFPKNWQLLGIVEKMMDVKKNQREKEVPSPLIKCRQCMMEFAEFELTTCSCVKATRCREVDFLGRPKNSLICTDCISSHNDHDHKPVSAVKTAWDCRQAINKLRLMNTKIRDRSEAADTSLDNAKKELAYLVSRLERTINRLDGRPRSEQLLSTASNFYNKLERINDSIEKVRKNVHDVTTVMGTYTSLVKSYGLKSTTTTPSIRNHQVPAPGIVADPNVPEGAPEIPIGDDGVLRIGNNGHFQLQFRVALNEGIAEGFQGDADRLVDNVVQRRLNDLMPLLREHIEDPRRRGNPNGRRNEIELRPVHRRVQLQRVNEGEEGIMVQMGDAPVQLLVRDQDGEQQIVADDNVQRNRGDGNRVPRHIQRAYELLIVQEAEEAIENAVEQAAAEDHNEHNEVAAEPERNAAARNPAEPRVGRGRAIRAAPNHREERVRAPYTLRSRGGVPERGSARLRGSAARNTRGNAPTRGRRGR